MFERFTERARQVVVLAQDEARGLKHNYIGTEHVLLGLLREEEGIAARALESVDVSVDVVRAQVSRIVGQGNELATDHIPFTPRAKRILELALAQALSLSHNYIGTEHLLLALVRENGGVASRVLDDLDADGQRVWNAVFELMRISPPPPWSPLEPGWHEGRSVDLTLEPHLSWNAESRWLWLGDEWPLMATGALIFVAGLVAGWLIWA